MLRTEADVVKRTLTILDKFDSNPAVINGLSIGQRVASRVILKGMAALLAQFRDSQAIATPKNLRELEGFLRKWNRLLIGTPLDWSHLAIKACIALAEDLATVFPYSALELLLPKVKIPEGFQTKHYNNFVITDDGYLIGIVEGLDAVRHDENNRFLHPVTKKEMNPDVLIEHSHAAWEYAGKIRNLFRPKQEDLDDCDRSRAALIKFIADDEISTTRLKPVHKETGEKRLMLALTKKVHNLTELAEFFDAYVPKNEWSEFLHAMDREELCRIVIPKHGQTPQKKDQADSDYKSEQATQALPALYDLATKVVEWPRSDMAKRALVYIMNVTYSEIRKDAPEYTDKFGGWGGGSFSRTQVLEQTKAMQEFLLSDANMMDLEKFLEEQLKAKKMTYAINSPTCLALKNKILDAGRKCEQTHEEKQEEKLVTAPSLSQ